MDKEVARNGNIERLNANRAKGPYLGWLSNTQVLAEAGLTPDFSFAKPHHLEAAIRIGKAVEQATLALDQGRGWKKLGWVAGYVEAWKLFKRDFKFKPELREERLNDRKRKITTKPDAWGFSRAGYITVQIKTCPVKDVVGLQLACEEYCIWQIDPIDSSSNRWGVELRSDGTYKPRRFDDRNDLRVFFSAVKLVRGDDSSEEYRKAVETVSAWKARHK